MGRASGTDQGVSCFRGTSPRRRYDGTYDKSKLPPGDLILTNYVRVRDGKIVEMCIVRVA
jgi:hypothetical protein